MTLADLLTMTKNKVIRMVIHHGLPGQRYRILEVTDSGVNATPLDVNTDWEQPGTTVISIPSTAEIVVDDSDNA